MGLVPERKVEETTVNKEKELIERARQKDTRAFAALVELHQERAIHTAYSFIGNFEDARDIAQDAFMKAYDHLDTFKGESRFFTWFYRILANASKDFLRKKKVRQHLSFWFGPQGEEDYDPMEKLAVTHKTASDSAIDRETESQVFEAMNHLPYRQRLAFCLRYLDGLSIEEISQSMAISVGAVKANIWQAVQKMRHYLGNTIEI